MEKIRLFHGSDQIIEAPALHLGRVNNDYGQGFYCTRDAEIAKEWACKKNIDGFVNTYDFDPESLEILDLSDGRHNILNWTALLLQNRVFRLSNEIAIAAREYLIRNFSIDVTAYDVIIGYRADDSYFSFAEAFVENGLSLRSLNQALRLGNLGQQIVLTSGKAFERISFTGVQTVEKEIHYPRFVHRDTDARQIYQNQIKGRPFDKEDIFVLDILREEMQNDDPRIQRIISQ